MQRRHNCFENCAASYSVSVITNFVIRKRDKEQTDKKAPPTIPTQHAWQGWHMYIEDVRPIFAPPNFFDPISSFTAKGY